MDSYLELVYFHSDVVSRPLVSQKEVFKSHPGLAVFHLSANFLELHKHPRFLLVIFSVGFNHFIMVGVLAGTHMSDFRGGHCKNTRGPQTSGKS